MNIEPASKLEVIGNIYENPELLDVASNHRVASPRNSNRTSKGRGDWQLDH